MLGLCPQVVGQPSHLRILFESPTRLQEFYATKHTTKLILPATTGSEHLLEHQRTMTNLVLVPT